MKTSSTLLLIIANCIFFLAMLVMIYKNPSFLEYIAIRPSTFLSGKYPWTIFTNMFMHGGIAQNMFMFMHVGIAHLTVNMISLLFLGSLTERIIGKKRFTIFYFSAGIFAAIFFVFLSLIFRSDFNALAVGASGAIFGVAGLLAVLTPKLPVYIMFVPIATPMWIAVIIILVFLWLVSLVAGLPIGNTAHLGGLIAGLFYGFWLRKKYKRKIFLLNKYLIR